MAVWNPWLFHHNGEHLLCRAGTLCLACIVYLSQFVTHAADKRMQESLKKWLNQGLGQKTNKMSLGHLTVPKSDEVHKKPDIPH